MTNSNPEPGTTASPDAPLVSVIIPTRHRLALLQRAVASINAQSYHNIEIIIVDNFSDIPLVRDDIKSECRVRVIRTDGMRPLPVNRNLGFMNSGGEFICFLDDDDTFEPHKVSEEACALAADPSLDFVYGQTVQIGAGGERLMLSSGSADITQFLRWRYVHVNALMLRREAFASEKFSPDMTTYEDVEFVGRLMRNHKGLYIPRVHAAWNRDGRSDQLTQRNWRRSYENWQRLCQRFDQEIMADRDLRRHYHRKMFLLSAMFGDLRQAAISGMRSL